MTPLQDPGPGDEKKTVKEEKPPKDKPAKEEGGGAGPVTDSTPPKENTGNGKEQTPASTETNPSEPSPAPTDSAPPDPTPNSNEPDGTGLKEGESCSDGTGVVRDGVCVGVPDTPSDSASPEPSSPVPTPTPTPRPTPPKEKVDKDKGKGKGKKDETKGKKGKAKEKRDTPARPQKREEHTWAGYMSQGSVYSNVKGSWEQPTAVCSKGENAKAAIWVGIGGNNQAKEETLEQTGTTVYCNNGKSEYRAWYELVPAEPVFLDPTKYPVRPGDKMQAEVSYHGNGLFLFKLSNQDWSFSTIAPGPTDDKDRDSAEWIVEDPPHCQPGACRLTKLMTGTDNAVNFSKASADGKPITTRGLTVEEISLHPPSSLVLAKPSALDTGGMSFSVKWLRSGPIR